MNINELLNEIKLDWRTPTGSTSGVLQSPKLKFIAAGCQAIAYYHKTHPNTVVKVAAVSGQDDPLWQFLRVCINHPDNPYFPTVFNHKMFNLTSITPEEESYLESHPEFEYLPIHDNRKLQLLIVTERLQELDNLQFAHHIARLGLRSLLSKTVSSQNANTSKRPITSEIAWLRLMDTTSGRNAIREIATDKHFVQALRIMEPLFAHAGFYADVHIGNMMLRKNGQLVFNDPLAIIVDD